MSSRFHKLLLATLVLATTFMQVVPANAGMVKPQYAATDVLLRLKPGANLAAVARDHRLKLDLAKGQLDANPIYRMVIEDGVSPAAKVAELSTDTWVEYAEPNYLTTLPEARQRSSWVVGESDNSDSYATQWASQVMRLPEAHLQTRGASSIVAVLDTGVDVTHPALQDHLTPGFDFIGEDSDPSEEGVYGTDSAFGHGTHVAGLVALAAPAARIMPLRTLGADGSGTIWDQVRALRYAIENGANVISLSWSFSVRSRVLDDALAEVTCANAIDSACRRGKESGVVVVAAAGNSGVSIAEYPAAGGMTGLIAVSASTEADTLASFSTYGTWVNLAAPGERIISTVPGGGYASWSGTSMATPLVAGTVALVRDIFPTYKSAEITSRITTSAAKITGPVHRRIDAAAAVRTSK